MLLRWVLTRDRAHVLTMADAYGSVRVEGDRVTRVRPESWDDVGRTYSINESLPPEEKIRTIVVKAEMEIIPAQKESYGSLRGGALESWARPNGSGDIVRIKPMDWTGLRFHSLDGRDIAIPVDSEYNPLRLPHPLAEYLIGTIPATTTPTAWPDPLFSAEQAINLWPPHEPNALSERATPTNPCLEITNKDEPTPPSGIRTNRAADAERTCEKWLAVLEERPKNKAAGFKAAVASCGGDLSLKAFEGAWARAVLPEWKRAGRRKKRV
jgi:hypothetical protein